MAYGDLPLDAPLKPNKGEEGGACNRRSCQAEPALWWNHGSHSWYCGDCARDIGEDHINRMGWTLSESYPGHPQFETREQIEARADEREAAKRAAEPGFITDYMDIDRKIEAAVAPYFGVRRGREKPQSESLRRMLGKDKKKGRRWQ
jgi:hypothetical protein